MEKIRSNLGFERITVSRIAILGVILALLIAVKYVLGAIPGIELVSFAFIFLGIFLPIIDLSLLIICFNVLVVVIYGFGPWWLMYWVIWPIDAFTSKLLSKMTRNRYIFAAWGFIAGMSVFFWYFISDLIFFDQTYAILNIISAIPINAIEGFTTMISIITIAPLLANVFNQFQDKFWNNKKTWNFQEVKYPKTNNIIMGFLIAAAITGIVLMFVYNGAFLDFKDALISRNHGKLPGGSGYDPFKH